MMNLTKICKIWYHTEEKLYKEWFFFRCRYVSRLKIAIWAQHGGEANYKFVAPKELREKRGNIIQDIYKLTDPYMKVCMECGGACCQGRHGRFSPLDLLFMKSPDNYRREINFALYDWRKLVSGKIVRIFRPSYRSYRTNEGVCRYLTERGCKLPYQLRPTVCPMFFCRRLIAAMDLETLCKLMEPLRNLESIMIEAEKMKISREKATENPNGIAYNHKS